MLGGLSSAWSELGIWDQSYQPLSQASFPIECYLELGLVKDSKVTSQVFEKG